MHDSFYNLSLSMKRTLCIVDSDIEFDANAIFQGEYTPDSPIVFTHTMGGGKPKDILATTHAKPFLVSQRFIDVLVEHRVTGWKTFPVTVLNKEGDILPRYTGFAVVGRSGPIDDSKRRVEYRTSPFNRGYRYKVGIGLYFDISTWDGSDIFTPQGGIIIVVKRVKELLEDAKILDLEFTNVNDYELAIIE